MKKSLLSLLLALTLSLPIWAQSIEQRPHIEVYGHAEGEFEPDEIYIQVRLSERDSKGKIPVFQQEKALFKIAARLKISKGDVELMGGDSQYAMYFWRKDQNQTVKVYRLKTHSALQASRLLYEWDRAKVSQARIEKVGRSDAEKLRKALEIKAIKDAKERARHLMQSIGNRIGKPLKVIQHRGYSHGMRVKNSYVLNDGGGGNPYDAQQFGQLGFKRIKYESDIQVWFEIE